MFVDLRCKESVCMSSGSSLSVCAGVCLSACFWGLTVCPRDLSACFGVGDKDRSSQIRHCDVIKNVQHGRKVFIMAKRLIYSL